MLCILKSVVPVGEEFQNSLDINFPPNEIIPATLTRFREQVAEGMRNLVHFDSQRDYLESTATRSSARRPAGYGTAGYVTAHGLTIRPTAESGSHLDDAFSESSRFIKSETNMNSPISELTTESGFYFLLTWPHSDTYSPSTPLWVSLLYYDGTSNSAVFITLKTSQSSPSMMMRFTDAVWAPGKDTFSRFYYLGKSCPKGAGIINWLW